MTLLDRIKELCMEKGTNPSKLEIELGFGRSTLYKWEKSSPTADKIEKVADYFDVTIDYLLGRTAFRNPMELFEQWGYSVEGFEAAFDFGDLLKKEREKQDITVEAVAEDLGITKSDVEGIEEGILPLNYDWAERYAKFLGTSVTQIFFDNDMYDEQIPSEFNEDVKSYETFKAARDKDAIKENPARYVTLAAHRTDGYDIDLPEEAREELNNYIELLKLKYGKKD